MKVPYHLRPWREDDALWYVGARDKEIFRWTTEGEQLTPEDFVSDLAEIDGVERAGFAIVDADGNLLGNVAAVHRDSRAEISYWVVASARGKGVATFALREMTSWVGEEWSVRRIELLISPGNAASVAVATRCGYAFLARRSSCLSCAGPDGTVVVYAKEIARLVS